MNKKENEIKKLYREIAVPTHAIYCSDVDIIKYTKDRLKRELYYSFFEQVENNEKYIFKINIRELDYEERPDYGVVDYSQLHCRKYFRGELIYRKIGCEEEDV